MARYVIVLALFALFAVALAQSTVSREGASEAAPRDLQTANAFGLGYYGGFGLHHGLLHHGFLHHGLLHRGFGFYG